MAEFSHVTDGKVEMVDVGGKEEVHREAVASGKIELGEETLKKIEDGDVEKGDVFSTARIAAIQGVKETWQDIPLCHPIPIDGVDVELGVGEGFVETSVSVRSTGKTGVEMEALSGVSRSLLTIWDMVKAVEKDDSGLYPDTCVQEVRVEKKVKAPLAER